MGDFAIPLGIRPPQIENPLDLQAKRMSLMQMAQQGQINQAKIQEEQLKARLAQEDQRDYEAIRQAYAKTPGDMNAVRTEIAGKINPRNLQTFDTSTLKHAQEMQKLDADKLAMQKDTAEQLARHLDAVGSVRPGDTSPEAVAARAAEWAKQVTLAKSKGYDPQGQLNPAAYPGDDQLPVLNVQLRGAQRHAEDELKRRDLADKEAAAQRAAAIAPSQQSEAESKVELARRQAASTILSVAAQQGPEAYAAAYSVFDPKVSAAFPKPEQFDPQKTPRLVRQLGQTPEQQVQSEATEQQRLQSQTPKTEAELARDATSPNKTPAERQAASDALRRLDQSKLASRPVTNVAIAGVPPASSSSKLTGDAYLATLPTAFANEIKAMAEGRTSAPSASSRAAGAAQKRAALFQYDPNWSEQRAQIRKSFATGKDGTNVANLNTATVHLDQLAGAAAALGNGSLQPGNGLYNYLRTTFGDSAPTNFEGLKTAVAGEMANALKGSATDTEIHNISQSINSAGSPKQLAGVVETHLHTLGAKLNTYLERYRQQIPDDTSWSPIYPSARAVYEKHGIDPTAGPAVNVSSGKRGGGAPPLPLTLQQSDVGKTFTTRAGKQVKITKVNPANSKEFLFDEVK